MEDNNSYDKEIKNFISNEIKNGIISLEPDSNKYFDEIETYYPIGFSGIDWNEKGNLFYYDLNQLSDFEKTNAINKILSEFILKNKEYKQQPVAIIGDGAIENVYLMLFEEFLNVQNYFFELPQHTYVYFIEIKKCLNYTFENELIFG